MLRGATRGAGAGGMNAMETSSADAVALKAIFQNIGSMAPRFSEMNKVRVIGEQFDDAYEGYVIASLFRDGRWVYKISISEDPTRTDPSDTFDNWIPEESLELTK